MGPQLFSAMVYANRNPLLAVICCDETYGFYIPHTLLAAAGRPMLPCIIAHVHKCRNLPLFSRRPSIRHLKLEHQDHKFTVCISVTDI